MKLIIGLGNPGLKYQFTRHNVGFLVVERLAKRVKVNFSERKFNSRVAQGKLVRRKTILVKPCTYMNLSGKAVLSFLSWTKLNLEDLLIVCDDVNLSFAALRIRPKGSSGGHNGLKSIIDCLGREDFPRLRLGVGAASREKDLEKHVLGQFSLPQKDLLSEFIDRAAQACSVWIDQGIEAAMCRFNLNLG